MIKPDLHLVINRPVEEEVREYTQVDRKDGKKEGSGSLCFAHKD